MDESENPPTNVVPLPLSDERIGDILRGALRRDEPGAALKVLEHAADMARQEGAHDRVRAFARLAGQQDILTELRRLASEGGGLITPLTALYEFHNAKLDEVLREVEAAARAAGLDPEQF